MMNLMIKEINYGSNIYKYMIKVREETLRLPLGLTLSPQDTEGEKEQIHIAALTSGEKVIATVILKPIDTQIVKLRQMAVSRELQGTGLGAKLVQHAEEIALCRGFQKVELHARISAQGFYEKLCYKVEGDQFFESTIQVIKMTKILNCI